MSAVPWGVWGDPPQNEPAQDALAAQVSENNNPRERAGAAIMWSSTAENWLEVLPPGALERVSEKLKEISTALGIKTMPSGEKIFLSVENGADDAFIKKFIERSVPRGDDCFEEVASVDSLSIYDGDLMADTGGKKAKKVAKWKQPRFGVRPRGKF